LTANKKGIILPSKNCVGCKQNSWQGLFQTHIVHMQFIVLNFSFSYLLEIK